MSTEKINESYRSCYLLEGGINCVPQGLVFCCDRPSPATIDPVEDVRKTVDAFLEARARIIHENQMASPPPPCQGCPLLQKCEPTDGKLTHLDFSVHTYCQFSCMYCDFGSGSSPYSAYKNRVERYDALEIAKEFKRRGLLSKNLHIGCAHGEITLHPRREEYYDFIEENADSVTFFTNAGKFDSRLARILQTNRRAAIYVSIDCGTKETFRKVHGVDMFQQVVDNLLEYRKFSSAIIPKYILLDENCGEEDLLGFIKICKDLNISHMIISGDLRKNYDGQDTSGYKEHIVRAALKLAEGAIENGMIFSLPDYFHSPDFREIHRRLLLRPEISSAEKQLDKILSAKQMVCYGAGGNCKNILFQIEELGLRKPDVIWDINAETLKKEEYLNSYPLCNPAFEQLDSSTDMGVFITIANRKINQELAADMGKHGFENILSHDRLALALLAKRARLLF